MSVKHNTSKVCEVLLRALRSVIKYVRGKAYMGY